MRDALFVDQGTGEVVEFKGGEMVTAGRTTVVSLELPDDISYEDWQNVGQCLQSVHRSLLWWIGDWLRYGEKRYGETYAQAIDLTGLAYDTVRAAKWVAEKFDVERRHPALTWSHHREAASLPPSAADQVLLLAEQEGWSTYDVRAESAKRKKPPPPIIEHTPAMMSPYEVAASVNMLRSWVESGQKIATRFGSGKAACDMSYAGAGEAPDLDDIKEINVFVADFLSAAKAVREP